MAGSSPPLERATTLPGRYYTDPEVFARERERVFAPGWVPVGRVSDVGAVGDYLTCEAAGEPVIVVRTGDGIRAFANVCRHRNMVMLEGGGHCTTIQCSYHLWTYRLDGSLAAAPSMQQAEGFDRDEHGLIPVALDTWGGWLLVNIDGTAPPLSTTCPGLGAIYDEAWLARLVPAASIHYESAFNWKIQVENFAESYHHAGVHAETLQPVFPGQRSVVVESGAEPWCGLDHVSVDDDLEPFTVTVVFPHLLFSWARPDLVVWFDLVPAGVDETSLDIRVLAEPDADPAVIELMCATLAQINEEDAAVNERTQAGLGSRFAVPGPISHLEKATWEFRNWVLERLGE
jgi:phenylpropionate dioxygenase-like ring-hydroxylating dioxygenase large terminal subunit